MLLRSDYRATLFIGNEFHNGNITFPVYTTHVISIPRVFYQEILQSYGGFGAFDFAKNDKKIV